MYNKLNHVELCVSAELVRDAARQAAPVIGALQAELPPLVPGYRTKMLDGNHLAASDHRLAELRRTWAAPLPGQILVVLDQQPMLATEVVLCEDGHAQERSLLGQVLPLVAPRRSVDRGSQLLHRGFSVWYCRARWLLCDTPARPAEGHLGRLAHIQGSHRHREGLRTEDTPRQRPG